jgi:ADP-ribosylation factor-like protein 6
MGNTVSNPFARKQEVTIMVCGLDNSGKSSIVSYLQPTDVGKEVIYIKPTVGFSLEKFTKYHYNWSCWDMSGFGRYRHLWSHYYQYVQGLIFVIDVTDKARIAVAKDELTKVLDHPDIIRSKTPILIFYNKNDEPANKKMHVTQVDKILHLNNTAKLKSPVHITECSALRGTNIDEGLRWLIDTIEMSAAADK